MGIMVSEIYEALIEAGASEAEAIPLAEQLVTKTDLAEVKADLKADISGARWVIK